MAEVNPKAMATSMDAGASHIGDEWDERSWPGNDAYALPASLILALHHEMPEWFGAEELAAEERFSAFCDQHHVVGVISGKLVPFSLLDRPPRVSITREQFEQLEWQRIGTFEEISRQISECEDRAEPFRKQAIAYAGWLLTNPTFLAEIQELKEYEIIWNGLPEDDSARRQGMERFTNFCSRWQLAGMASWELPLPQGPNLTGLAFPETVASKNAGIQLTLPISMRLPARFPTRELVSEIRDHSSFPHLAQWRQILGQESKHEAGLSRFADILRLHFYRNVALKSRYADRFQGRVEPLDRAFAKFLDGRQQDSVKKLRLLIEKRLHASL